MILKIEIDTSGEAFPGEFGFFRDSGPTQAMIELEYVFRNIAVQIAKNSLDPIARDHYGKPCGTVTYE